MGAILNEQILTFLWTGSFKYLLKLFSGDGPTYFIWPLRCPSGYFFLMICAGYKGGMKKARELRQPRLDLDSRKSRGMLGMKGRRRRLFSHLSFPNAPKGIETPLRRAVRYFLVKVQSSLDSLFFTQCGHIKKKICKILLGEAVVHWSNYQNLLAY